MNRRSNRIVLLGLGLAICYYALQLAPLAVRTIIALVLVPSLVILSSYIYGYRRIRSRARRRVYLLIPSVIIGATLAWMRPDWQRTRVKRELIESGARVTLDFETTYLWLPRWLKQELNVTWFGKLKQVDYSHRPIPSDQLENIYPIEPIWFLNAEGAQTNNANLGRLVKKFDAQIVNLSRTNTDLDILRRCAQMPSIKRIYVVHCDIPSADAALFRNEYPNVELVTTNTVTSNAGKGSGSGLSQNTGD